MHSSNYILIFVFTLTVIVALVLSLMSTGLKDLHDLNEAIFNKKAILSAIETELGEDVNAEKLITERVQEIFDTRIDQLVVDRYGTIVDSASVEARGYKGGKAEDIDMAKEKKKPPEDRYFPVFIYTNEEGEKIYIISVRGSGLWDEIWGNIALNEDFKTIVGAAFDHAAETPGLGAEIKDNPSFSDQFVGKKIYDDQGVLRSVTVRKGGARNTEFEVDGISGATITGNGVNEMLENGFKFYEPYFNTVKKG